MPRRSGFTLLELLSVMAIMVILMSISGAAYYGMSRGAALRGAASNVRSALSLARQYAATRRKSTHVLLWQDSTNAYYRTFVEVGTDVGEISNNSQLEIYGSALSQGGLDSLVGGTIYNLSSLDSEGYKWGIITNNRPDGRMSCAVTTNAESAKKPMIWYTGDISGWAVGSVGILPAGVKYDMDLDDYREVVFKPNGTSRNMTEPITIELKERRGSGKRTITVRPVTGLIVSS